jgi:hypothetical protein
MQLACGACACCASRQRLQRIITTGSLARAGARARFALSEHSDARISDEAQRRCSIPATHMLV